MNRRQVILTGAATMAATALPMLSMAGAIPAMPKAEMFYTPDEPWGCFVRGHVTQEQYAKAALKLLDHDPDIRDNAEDWLFEEFFGEDDDTTRVIKAEAEHSYMRLVRTDDPELGDVYNRCEADDQGAIPITVVMY